MTLKLLAGVIVSLIATSRVLSEPLLLRYSAPANAWVEALPVGNGRLGAVVFGGATNERLQLNEATLWSGGPRDWNNPSAKDFLPKVREAIFVGKYDEAEALCKKMQGPYNQSYLPMGDLKLTFAETEVQDYQRTLDLDSAVVTTTYQSNGATFTREVFSSFPDQVIVVRISCDQPGKVSFTASLDSQMHHQSGSAVENGIAVVGRTPSHVEPSYVRNAPDPVQWKDDASAEFMTFDLRIRAITDGGTTTTENGSLKVSNANAVTLLISARTSFNGFDKSPRREGRDPKVESSANLDAATKLSYDQLRARHVEDHQKLFRRISIDLGHSPEAESLDTPARLKRFAEGHEDPSLSAMVFHYGRYLLIASSRPGGQPANLQGIWNDQMRPPWSSNYTININTQMNYWLAEPTNLSECALPLFDFIKNLSVNGAKTAQVNYGMHGWVSHHNADLWRQSAPVGNYGQGDPVWANYAMSAPWLCQHLWEHYAYTRDEKFLREQAWPIMKGAAEFCLDWLVDDGQGHLVTAPSASPELGFTKPNGKRGVVTKAATMDMEIIWDLFTNCIEASKVLKSDPEFIAKIELARSKLLPLKIGSRGNIQEWADDLIETEVHHRHVSHLFGLHPGRQITPATPEMFEAARKTLEIRGDDATGWSLAWKINFWARLCDGDHAFKLIQMLMHPVGAEINGERWKGGGVYPNLFDAHPPFQIDGNFGFTAGVVEMLLQSHQQADGKYLIDLLPALPTAWTSGKVTGLRARGGLQLSIEWNNGKLTKATVSATVDSTFRLRSGASAKDLTLPAGSSVQVNADLNTAQ